MTQAASPPAPVARALLPLWLQIVLVAVAANLLRLAASLDEFWLDEIWSWGLVREQVQHPLDILLALHHDNNHLLTSWWIYTLGPDVDWRWYRLPSVLLGSATVLLARRAVRQDGRHAVRAVTLLTAPSYLLIHYTSEARGYAGMMFAVAACLVLLQRLLPPGRNDAPMPRASGWRRGGALGLFWLSAMFGCLAHATFYYAFAALGLWACYRLLTSRTAWLSKIAELLALFVLPGLFALILWLVSYSQLQIGGGDIENPWLVGTATASLLLGGPGAGEGILLGALLLAILVGLEIGALMRMGDDRWVLWLAMLVVPAVLIALLGHEVIYPRYFLATVLCLQLALGCLLGRALSRRGTWRVVAWVVLAGITLGNGLHLQKLYRDGRGHPAAAVRWMAERTAGEQILVGSDNAFRHGLVLGYYLRELPPDKKLLHFGSGPWPPGGPEWLLLHNQDLEWAPEPDLQVGDGLRFRLEKVYPYAGLSGWQTAVYRNAAFESKTPLNRP